MRDRTDRPDVPPPGTTPDGVPGSSDEPLATSEVKRLAIRGVALVSVGGVAIRLIALGCTVVLAHLLTPQDFGIIALGYAVLGVGRVLSDGGIAAGLIRTRQRPRHADLQSMMGFQLLLASGLSAVIAAVSLNFGMTGQFLALVSASLPIMAVRTPALVMLERRLAYRPLILVEMAEAATYYGCALSLVALGAGIWGIGIAMIVRAAIGSAGMLVATPGDRVLPRLRWARIRPLLGFGFSYQAIDLVGTVWSQGLSFAIITISNAATLGLWSLVQQLMNAPLTLFNTLWRVSYPTMARLVDVDARLRTSLENGTRIIGVTSGLIIAGLVGAGPAVIPFLFGPIWQPAVPLLPWVGLAMAIGTPISVAADGYLLAKGEVTTLLRSAIAVVLVQFAVTPPLLPFIGIQAAGIGMLAAIVAEAIVLTSAMRRLAGTRLVLTVVASISATILAAGAGWAVATGLGSSLLAVAASGSVAGGLYLVVIALVDRSGVRDTLRVARRALERPQEAVGARRSVTA